MYYLRRENKGADHIQGIIFWLCDQLRPNSISKQLYCYICNLVHDVETVICSILTVNDIWNLLWKMSDARTFGISPVFKAPLIFKKAKYSFHRSNGNTNNWIEPRHEKTCFLAYARTKPQTSCAITTHLISDFEIIQYILRTRK